MRKSKYTESQIIGLLNRLQNGEKITDLCREAGISQGTLYQWKSKYSGMDVSQLKKLKELEHEIAQYKKIVAEQMLQITVLKDVIEKKL